jgi:hypothetical protein
MKLPFKVAPFVLVLLETFKRTAIFLLGELNAEFSRSL